MPFSILSFLLLMVVFRSLVLPLKAVIMNLLSVGAAYGVMVAVFQWGWAGSVIGIGETGPIDPWIPVALFVVLFGLSMDYEVFLLSRIREEWLRTHENSLAVADGLAITGRIITAAAAIMFCVFASFVIKDPLAHPQGLRARAWPPPCSSTRPWSAWCSSRPSWRSWGRSTGGYRAGWTVRSRRSGWR